MCIQYLDFYPANEFVATPYYSYLSILHFLSLWILYWSLSYMEFIKLNVEYCVLCLILSKINFMIWQRLLIYLYPLVQLHGVIMIINVTNKMCISSVLGEMVAIGVPVSDQHNAVDSIKCSSKEWWLYEAVETVEGFMRDYQSLAFHFVLSCNN